LNAPTFPFLLKIIAILATKFQLIEKIHVWRWLIGGEKKKKKKKKKRKKKKAKVGLGRDTLQKENLTQFGNVQEVIVKF